MLAKDLWTHNARPNSIASGLLRFVGPILKNAQIPNAIGLWRALPDKTGEKFE